MRTQGSTVPAGERIELGAAERNAGRAALGVGSCATLAAVLLGLAREDHLARLQHAWLFGCLFFLSLSLGALFFVIVQHLTRAAWSVVVRRIAELIAANVPVVALLFAPLLAALLAGRAELYPWGDPEFLHASPLLDGKATFLEPRFFTVRCALYFVIWSLSGRWLLARSREQDRAQGPEATLTLERRAAPLLVLFALSLNFAAFDMVMTLDPSWYSTIFGVYVFAGSVVGFFAVLVVLLCLLQARGYLARSVHREHYHDLGKFLFAFVFFWSYIAFSQFLLIWYADLPEETHWFHARGHGSWRVVALLLVFGHCLLPFAGLLSRHVKRRAALLCAWAVWLLVMHAVDLFWLILPAVESEGTLVDPIDALALVGVGGVWLFALVRRASGGSLLPRNDPRLPQSLAFENL